LRNSARALKGYGYRWLVWGVMCLAYLIVCFHRVAVGVVADNLMSEFAITGAAIGNLGAVYFYVYTFMQIPSGVLADTLGARKTVSAGTLVAGIGSILFGLAPGMAASYTGRFLVGLGVSVIFIAILKVQSQWFKEREFATVSGLTSLIGNGGALMAGLPLALAVSLYHWRTVFLAIGLVSVLIAVLNYLIVRNSPEAIGLPGLTKLENGKRAAPQNPRIAEGLKVVVTSRNTWMGFITFAGLSGAILSLTGMWGVPYLMAVYGLEKTPASSYIMAASVGMMAGSLAIGAISDKAGKRKTPLLAFSLANLAIWLALVLWNNGKPPLAILYPMLFLLGFTAMGYVLTWALGKEANPPQIAGIATGTVNIGGFLGPAVLQPLMGYVLDLGWLGEMAGGSRIYTQAAYARAFSLCAAAVLLAVLSTFFMQETHCRNIYQEQQDRKRASLVKPL